MRLAVLCLWTLALGVPNLQFLQQTAGPDLSAIDLEGEPGLVLRDSVQSCRMGWLGDQFGVEYIDPILTVSSSGSVSFNRQLLTPSNLFIGSTLTMNNVRQWQLIQVESFSGAQADGWSVDRVTTCGGVTMMGGYCELASESTTKTFVDLPLHSQVRIVATFHFLDQWEGESGFLRTEVNNNLAIVWTDRHTLEAGASGFNICGSDRYPENKFAALVDVTIAHARDSLTVEFGSTLDEQPCTHSYGVSGFQLYIR